MKEITLLSVEEIFGENKLDIFKHIGTHCLITDYGILLGGVPAKAFHFTSCWWTRSLFETAAYGAYIVGEDGSKEAEFITKNDGGIKPAIVYSEIKEEATNKEINPFDILQVEYGEYPQTAVNPEMNYKLETYYQDKKLNRTGKHYMTIDVLSINNLEQNSPKKNYEYEYCGKKYVRLTNTRRAIGRNLHDGRRIEKEKVYWVEVEPIIWYVDEKKDIAVSSQILMYGIPYHHSTLEDGSFEKTDMYYYLNKYFKKEIKTQNYSKNVSNIRKRINTYNFDYSKTSEEEIIKGAIESNISVFLHGKSSEGKSARVKQIDPDCVIIYLRNATPESLNGKSVYNAETGEMIDIKPTWLKKLENICEKEPDKNHIVFFDEITNALPSIQGIAFNIVLDKEVNGIWKLPDNARIVAAGNEMNDSLAANQLVEPLFNRFAHVYINTTVDSWLGWASKNNIHPAIYAYISYRKEEALRREYNGETPNADPRKWEMASNMLYKTGKPEMLRALLGQDITNEFIWFTKQKVITLEDVLNYNYTEEDLNLNTGEKYMTVVGLLNAKEEDYQKVLEFLKKLGSEFISIFNSLWTKDNEERLEIIAESKQDIKKKIRKI